MEKRKHAYTLAPFRGGIIHNSPRPQHTRVKEKVAVSVCAAVTLDSKFPAKYRALLETDTNRQPCMHDHGRPDTQEEGQTGAQVSFIRFQGHG